MDNSKIDIGMYLKDRRVQYAMIALALISGIIVIAYVMPPLNSGGNDNIANNTTLLIDTNSNNNKIDNKVVSGQEIRFIVVGDPHIKSSSSGSDRGNERLRKVINLQTAQM